MRIKPLRITVPNLFFGVVQVILRLAICVVPIFLSSFNSRDYLKTIQFSGMEWEVKKHDRMEGPGPNYFSDSDSSVWVDATGRLHLQLRYVKGKWWCAEVIGTKAIGLGTIEFKVEGLPDHWDPNCVLGLFTWSTAKSKHHSEVDIEYSNWGKKKNQWNLQYVVQPHKKKKNKYRFTTDIHQAKIHQIMISKNAIAFSTSGKDAGETRHLVRKRWDPKFEVFPRINLWLYQGQAPTSKTSIEVIITSYKFLPSP